MIHLVAQTGGFGSVSTVVFAVFLVLRSFQGKETVPLNTRGYRKYEILYRSDLRSPMPTHNPYYS